LRKKKLRLLVILGCSVARAASTCLADFPQKKKRQRKTTTTKRARLR